ncbi:hypothetical protein IAE29_23140 [Ochrobactrum sp. S46]|nr:hypothetical protein [Ochrobactrum sp. S45]MBK0046224.1 hypothetical protein [Ochrobactrum sp. S46]
MHYIDVTNFAGTRAKIEEVAAAYDGIIIIARNEPRLADGLHLMADKVAIVTLVTDIPASRPDRLCMA